MISPEKFIEDKGFSALQFMDGNDWEDFVKCVKEYALLAAGEAFEAGSNYGYDNYPSSDEAQDPTAPNKEQFLSELFK